MTDRFIKQQPIRDSNRRYTFNKNEYDFCRFAAYMSKQFLIFCLWVVWPTVVLKAQTLRVLDANTGDPISEVFIYNRANQSVLTNSQGEVDISVFGAEDVLTFQHAAYQAHQASMASLKKQGYRVRLQEKVVRIEEVLVAGNKWEQDKQDIPVRIASINAGDIARGNPQTSADLLSQSGEVFVQKSQLGGGSPMIRGFAANSVLIVVDGVRMNNAIFRSGNLQNVLNVDANLLENAEVVLGPGSVIYGSDALGGVMDFHTLEAPYTDDFTAKAGALVRYSSVNHEKTGSAQVMLSGKNWSTLLGGTYSDFDDLRAGRNGLDEHGGYGQRPWYASRINGQDTVLTNPDPSVQIGSGYQAFSGFSKTKFRLADALELSASSIISSTGNVPRYDRLIEIRNGKPRSAQWYYGPQRWWMNTLRLAHFNQGLFYDEARITLSRQDYEESRHDRKFGKELLRHRTETVGIWTANMDFDKVLNEQHQLFYGAEFIHNRVRSSAERQNINTGELTPTATRYPDLGSEYATLAAYANHKWYPWAKATLTTGLRYSHVVLQSQFSNTFYDFPFTEIELNTGALNGSIGLAQRVGDRWQINAVVSSGYRAPNVDDVGKVFDSEPGNVVVPNPDLAPEFVYNTELGGRYTWDGKVEVHATAFYAWYVNAMVRRPFSLNGKDSLVYDGTLSRIEALVNTGEARVYGVSGGITVTPTDQWIFKGNLTWTEGRDLDGNIPLRHTPPLFGRLSATWQKDRWRATFWVPFQGARAWEDLAPSEQDKAHLYPPGEVGALAWYTLNLNAQVSLGDKYALQVGVENILDLHYRPYSSGISAPGRNWIVAIRKRL